MSEQPIEMQDFVENTLTMTLDCPLCNEEIVTTSPFAYNIAVKADGAKVFSVSTSKFIEHSCTNL